MKNRKYTKAVCMFLIAGMMCLSVTGCKQKPDENGSLKAEDGRSYGGTIKGKMGEKVHTAFFDITVEEATKNSTFQFEDGLYQADEGNTYLVVKVTIQNTYGKDLPMSISDFTLTYKGNKEKEDITGFGKADLNQDEYMDNIFTLKKGESITKNILFTVSDQETYQLCYLEYYADKFEGDSYRIRFTPKNEGTTADVTADTGTDTEATTGVEETTAPVDTDTTPTEAETVPTDTEAVPATEAAVSTEQAAQ